MIKKIFIKNYKSIKDLALTCNQMNLFVGTNSSGKSTTIESILMTAQNVDREVGLNGELVRGGSYDDIHCRYSAEREILSAVEDEKGNSIVISFGAHESGVDKSFKGDRASIEEQLNYAKGEINYLSCNRIGPSDIYHKNLSLVDNVGINGEFTMGYLNEHGQDRLDDSLCKTKSVLTLLGQVNWWLKYIADAEINTTEVPGSDIIVVSYNMRDINGVRPRNIGAGISYLVSVLVICLASKDKSVLLIENPEIHLHPRAQSRLTEFLYFVSASGRQLFVETHSDHVFNGIRAGIASGDIDSGKIDIDFFYLNEENLTQCEQIKIGTRGKIENPLPDLFEQFNIDLDKMLGI